jgi:hypothetical protein
MRVLVTTRGSSRHLLALAPIGHACNVEAVARCGAGLALDAERASRRVLELPRTATIAELRPALERALSEPPFKREAKRIAASVRALPPVDRAPAALAELTVKRAG